MTTCWGTKKDKTVNKETAFIRNGSKLLEKLVEIWDGKCNSIRRFSATELEKATNNYDPRKLLTEDSGYKLHTPIIVFEYVGEWTLKDCLWGSEEARCRPLQWIARSKIAMDMANAVAFLHAAFARPIVFRNITPSKILLDDNHEAKLSDFSLSISIPEGESHVTDAGIMGTYGFVAPEYMTTGDFNEKQDVFNFGVFLLVLLSGQMQYDYDHSRPAEERFLEYHVKKCVEDDRLNEAIDSTIIAEGAWPGKEQQLQAFAALALEMHL
ncbi:WALL-ASSOCIATED RECEPTOR KINASE-LIKE 21 [Salix purpurea]|uniref:WALL-ASSOCIATED RECEPTOR KINASE-LIKE 21 n=1 Tax=Salix purpurea TaxID=77065 RepID=A0A9Q0W8N5_SALPP|nr:WALL-ASSOCIATED RECEPTOR KINASE-LIKE 21 [Salix purpurea]